METTQIIDAYISYVLEHNAKPSSVYLFAKHLNISESEFYNHFSSFEGIEKGIWLSFFEATLLRLNADESYQDFGAREKLLAFYYTWIEELLKKRSYVSVVLKEFGSTLISAKQLAEFKEAFLKYAEDIVNTGKETNEIAEAGWFTSKYADGIWYQLVFVLNFWLNDSSNKFEKTDAAIEKAVNLSFEFMGSNLLKSAFDFGKFLLQKK